MTRAAPEKARPLDRRVVVLLAGLCLVAVVLDAVWFARAATPLATPSLLLVLVVGAGLLAGPSAGAVAGLAAGLLADLTPPSALVAGTGAAGLAVAGVVAGALRRRRDGPHVPPPWLLAVRDAATTGVAALAGLTATAVARAPDTLPAALAVLPGIGVGAAYAAAVALFVLPVVHRAARRVSAR